MNLAAIASGIFAVAKAIPKIMELFDQVESLVLKWRLSQITDEYQYKRDKLRAVISAISRAETREERIALSKVLHDYTSGRFNK